jgi:hypothetical protein
VPDSTRLRRHRRAAGDAFLLSVHKETGFASKVQNRTWKQSVPSAVTDGFVIPKCEIAIDYEYDRFTHPLSRTVLTVSKRDVLTFEACQRDATVLFRGITITHRELIEKKSTKS